MQKNWLRVFLLCVACAVCLHGNCSAERWVQYFISFGDKIFMDIDSIKAWEYKGRKYLGAYVKGNLVASISKELYVLVDLENERKLELNKSCILNGQIDDRYFDILINTPRNKKIVSPQEYVVLSHGKLPVEKAFMQCAEQNRPDVINEILAYNTSGAVSQGAPSVGAQTGDLDAEAAQIQKWLQEGKTNAYNAGVGFEWWDEKAKADFEALPFSNDIAEVCSHVYRFSHYSDGSVVTYVVLVPRHVRISYGGGEYETFDSLVIANIARKNYDPVDHQMIFEPLDGAWESAYIKEGRTQSIVYLPGDDTPPLDWKWLENGQEEIEQKGGTVNLLGSEFFYTFEGTNNPNSFILHGYYDFDWPNKESQRGSFEVLPGITLPTKSGNYEE